MKREVEQWLLKPGDSRRSDKIEDVIQRYMDTTEAKRTVCINESNEVLYFLSQLDEEGVPAKSDVAILHNDDFVFLPKQLAEHLGVVFVAHSKLMAEAYDFVTGEGEGEEHGEEEN